MSSTLDIFPSLGKRTSILIPPSPANYAGIIQLAFIAKVASSLHDGILEVWTDSPSEVDGDGSDSRSWHAVQFENVQLPSELEKLKGPLTNANAVVKLDLSTPFITLNHPIWTSYIAHINVPARPLSFEYAYRITSPTSPTRWLGDARGNGTINLVHQEERSLEVVHCVKVEEIVSKGDGWNWLGREERTFGRWFCTGVEIKDGRTPIIHSQQSPPGTLLKFLLITPKPTDPPFATFYPLNTPVRNTQPARIVLPDPGTAIVNAEGGIYKLVSVNNDGQIANDSDRIPKAKIIPLSFDLSHLAGTLFSHIATNLSHSHLSLSLTLPNRPSPTHIIIFNLQTASESHISIKTFGGSTYALYCDAQEKGAIVKETTELVDVVMGGDGLVAGAVLEVIPLKDIPGGKGSIGCLDPDWTLGAISGHRENSDVGALTQKVESSRNSSEGESETIFSELEAYTGPSHGVETSSSTSVEPSSDVDATDSPPKVKSRLPPPRVSWTHPSDGSPGIPLYVDIDTDNPSTSTEDREDQMTTTSNRPGSAMLRAWWSLVGGWLVFWAKVGLALLARKLRKKETVLGESSGNERTPLIRNASQILASPVSQPRKHGKRVRIAKKSDVRSIPVTVPNETERGTSFTISHPPPFHFLVTAETQELAFEARRLDHSDWLVMESQSKREVGNGLYLISVVPREDRPDSMEGGHMWRVKVGSQ